MLSPAPDAEDLAPDQLEHAIGWSVEISPHVSPARLFGSRVAGSAVALVWRKHMVEVLWAKLLSSFGLVYDFVYDFFAA